MNTNIHTAGIAVRPSKIFLAFVVAGILALAGPAPTAHADPPGAVAFHGHDRQGHGGVCGARGEWGLSRLDGTVAKLIDFNPTQYVAWNDLMTTAGEAQARVRATCREHPIAGATAPERLVRLEAITAARLGGLQAVRPKFDMFYATLSDRQREGLTALMERHRHRHRNATRAPMRDR